MYIPSSSGLNKWFNLLTTILVPCLFLNVHFIEQSPPLDTAPDFSLIDLEGNTHQLSQYKDQYVVLEWLNLRCRTVDRLYKTGAIPALQQQLADEEVVWLSITSSEVGKGEGTVSNEQLKRRLEKRGGQQEAVLLDEMGQVGKLYGVSIEPYFVVIGPDGKMIYEGAFDNIPDPRAEQNEELFNYVEATVEQAKRGEEVSIRITEPYGCEVKYQR